MAEPPIEVRGGGDPTQVAAVVAAVVRVLAEEAAKAGRPPPPRQHPWVLVNRYRQSPPTLYNEPKRAPVGWGLASPGPESDRG